MTETSDLAGNAVVPSRVASSRLGLETLVVKLAIYVYALPGSVVLARTLGPSGRGAYQVAVTVSLIVLTLVLVGLPQSQFRSWGRHSAQEMLAISRLAAVVLGGVGALICVLVARGGDWVSTEAGRDALVIIGLTLPAQVHSACLVVVLQSAARTRSVNVAFGISGLVGTSGILLLWMLDRLTIRSTATTYAIGLVVQWAVLWGASRSFSRAVPRAPLRAAAALARSGLVLQVFIVTQFLLLRIDVLFVAELAGLHDVGIYAVGVMLAELVWLVTDSLAQVLIERATEADEPAAIGVFIPAVRMTILLGVLAAVVTGALAPLVVPKMFGREFADSAHVVALLLPGVVAMGVWRSTAPAVVRFGRLWSQPAFGVVALLINLGACVLLIEPLGAAGAALGSTVAYVVAAVLSTRWLLDRTGHRVSAILPGVDDLGAVVRSLRSLRP
jgi:O-antigen/teichoic acid export membrane protein